MELQQIDYPARSWKTGAAEFTIDAPTNLKIQTTGTDAITFLNEGPPHGKQWAVTLRLEIVET